MRARILLVLPRHRDWMRVFPFGIAAVYSVLKEHGYDVHLIDCDYNYNRIEELITPQDVRRYDIIGIGGLVSAYKEVKYEIVPFLKSCAPDSLIAVGGYLGLSAPDLLLRNRLCDVLFLGDAEESILEFLQVYPDKKDWSKIRGIAYLTGENTITNTGIRLTDDIEAVHVPYYKHIDLEWYNCHRKPNEKEYPLVVEIGCPYNCSFCFNSGSSRIMRRSPEHVIDEIRVALKQFGYPRVSMMAENLLSKPKWMRRFCELIRHYDLDFRWAASGHANHLTEDMLQLIASHGCDSIGIGFENFSQKILDNMNKKTKVEQYINVIKLLRQHDFQFSGTCIFGYLGEDHQTVEENIRFMKDYVIPRDYFWIQPYPLTTLYKQCIEKGLIKDEELHLERLGDAKDYVINISQLSDKQLFQARARLDSASKQAMWPYPRTIVRATRLYGVAWYPKEFSRALKGALSYRYARVRRVVERLFLSAQKTTGSVQNRVTK